ncbi:AMI001Wp (mitochondrion) [Eremothecium gossypii ATCC 10895]|uniref:Cytochrome c oxidase subunit 2 n=1 Tax=Eremothecium gossypii (strain ATCC 10895 / CBS 109.51 / FGSC 9923 / NRRL Y-1056) TaxID=284811 RepID=COX2_EREGS|nr:AMI001Wp [Eremothecium gossypii ATCC 10895]Q7YFV7.2 RecName: Full=Cytochrome c oxidase subunit 2; AltName: Full=Cytochrome c oxidase polypeptide II; Flags: Precursor [Eremothecium gossypii ATCC 10895]AAS50168.1 AMI001Wp [Eremothecium gossypii ATCC 10895]
MLLMNLFTIINNDVPTPYNMYFQDSTTPHQEGILELHDNIMFYMLTVLGLVSWMMIIIIKDYKNNPITYKYIKHGQMIEIIWTILPAIILLMIAFPSFILLYLCDEVISPAMTIKVIGLQWYWKYEYSDFINDNGETIEYESYMIPEELLEEGQLRMLDTDTSIVIPVDTHVRFIVTATDVIHDFAVPSLGIKIDTTPGRLSQVSTLIQREGIFYGQCSELCGAQHSAMPIKIETVKLPTFLTWLNEQ